MLGTDLADTTLRRQIMFFVRRNIALFVVSNTLLDEIQEQVRAWLRMYGLLAKGKSYIIRHSATSPFWIFLAYHEPQYGC